MASIPHGTTINAQGVVPGSNEAQSSINPAVDIKATSIVPFDIKEPNAERLGVFKHLDFDGTDQKDRLPNDLKKFNSA